MRDPAAVDRALTWPKEPDFSGTATGHSSGQLPLFYRYFIHLTRPPVLIKH